MTHLYNLACSATSVDPQISCDNNKLAVRWPTSTVYQGNMTTVPVSVYLRIRVRMQQLNKNAFQVTITSNNPP